MTNKHSKQLRDMAVMPLMSLIWMIVFGFAHKWGWWIIGFATSLASYPIVFYTGRKWDKP